ncbi:MAG: hypothetical protein LBR71_01020 [Synergistaceae bacterium]|jgi:hypothetical protein|nr:hypothetical protein [Synergistaceae bacterium]
MDSLVNEIEKLSAAMQNYRPEDIKRMRLRMGARSQNASITLYAFGDIGTAANILYFLERDIPNEAYDLRTMLDTASHWLALMADRIPRYYRHDDTGKLLCRVLESLKSCNDRAEARKIIGAIQHYLSALDFWIDLEIPWPEIGAAFAEAKGDPAPAVP